MLEVSGRMQAMWATGNKANRLWIYVLTACLVFFVALTIGMFVFSLYENYTWKDRFRVLAVFCLLIASCFGALQKRRTAHSGR